MEDRFFATVFFGSALLFLAMLFVAAALIGAVILLACDHLSYFKDKIHQPMTSSMLGIFPEFWFPATTLALPITCFEISRILSRLELLVPPPECVFVKVPN
jgi:hypothetical protein